jgi:hypothetical protein
MNVRDMQFDLGAIERLQRIKQRDGSERKARRVDDDSSGSLASLVNRLYKHAFEVRLPKVQSEAVGPCPAGAQVPDRARRAN